MRHEHTDTDCYPFVESSTTTGMMPLSRRCWNVLRRNRRMLAESPLDRAEVRRLRDSGRRDGRVRAIRYVREWDPVPREIAAQFVDRV